VSGQDGLTTHPASSSGWNLDRGQAFDTLGGVVQPGDGANRNPIVRGYS
jgi:hypothetical protein